MEKQKTCLEKLKSPFSKDFWGDPLSERDLEKEFQEIENSDEPRREKRVQRYILAVESLVNKKYKGNWEKAPWLVQFFPLIVKFLPELKYAKAVNPGLDGFSGFMGTSKQSIVDRLNKNYRPDHVFFEEVPTYEELEQRFEQTHNKPISFPIICKPDIGERATGVIYIQNKAQLEEYLQNAEPNFHLEKFYDQKEFALSWTRDPQTGEYRIWSVIEKQIPCIVGDGKTSFRELLVHKIEELELAHDRKEKILACYSREELDQILPEGEQKRIVKTASISYGTTFKKIEPTEMQTQQLRILVSQFIENPKGLYQGRFDLRAESFEELTEGNAKIIELNGVGGMPMEIYESHLSVPEKYKLLFKYFSYILEIAKENVDAGRAEKATHLALPMHVGRLLFTKNKTQELAKTDQEKRSLREDVKYLFKLVRKRGKGYKKEGNIN